MVVGQLDIATHSEVVTLECEWSVLEGARACSVAPSMSPLSLKRSNDSRFLGSALFASMKNLHVCGPQMHHQNKSIVKGQKEPRLETTEIISVFPSDIRYVTNITSSSFEI